MGNLGEGDSEPLITDSNGIPDANIKSWSTRNAAVGVGCIVAALCFQTGDTYTVAFSMCLYREFSDTIEKFFFEPKNSMLGVAYGCMGLVDIYALYLAMNMP